MNTSEVATVVAVCGSLLLFVIHFVPLLRSRWFARLPQAADTLSGPPHDPTDHDRLKEHWRRLEQQDRLIESQHQRAEASRRFWVQVFVTAVVLLSAIYVLVFKPDAETSLKDFCYTSVGAIIGFWLKA
jgi:hypothetical protein